MRPVRPRSALLLDPRQRQVEEALARARDEPARVLAWRRSRFSTSHPLDELTVVLGEAEVQLVFKDLDPQALIPQSQGTKPCFLTNPRRELLTYSRVLAGNAQLAPFLYALDLDRSWMVLERVDGVELWQVGDPAVWVRAARWLAGLHDAIDVDQASAGAPMVQVDPDLIDVWVQRAMRNRGKAVRPIVEAVGDVCAVLADMPRTFLHGEAYPSNLFVRRDGGILGIDWEMAGVGPCVIDLAALITGWLPEVRARMIDGYRQTSAAVADVEAAALDAGVRAASLVQCLQWLGWSEGWTPPEEHARDWQADAHHHLQELRRCV